VVSLSASRSFQQVQGFVFAGLTKLQLDIGPLNYVISNRTVGSLSLVFIETPSATTFIRNVELFQLGMRIVQTCTTECEGCGAEKFYSLAEGQCTGCDPTCWKCTNAASCTCS
jgi:hypothetical protein